MNHDEIQSAANKMLWWGGASIAVLGLWKKLAEAGKALWGFVATPFRLMKKLTETVEQLTKVVKSLEETMNGQIGVVKGQLSSAWDMASIAYQHSLLQFNDSPLPHFECTLPSGECVYVNKALADLFGMEMDQMLGFGWSNAVHPDDVDRVKAHWLQSIEHWRGYKARYRIVRLGEVITVDATGLIIADANGRPLRVWGTVSRMPIHL